MKKINVLLAGVAALGAFTLASCAGNDAESETSKAPVVTETQKPATPEVIERKYYTVADEANYTVDYVLYGQREILIQLTGALETAGDHKSLKLTGRANDFGGINVVLTLTETECFFDVTCDQTMPGLSQEAMNAMFDKKGTYTYNETDNEYEFVIQDKAPQLPPKPAGK